MRPRLRHFATLATFVAFTTVAASCHDSSAPEKAGPPADIAISAGDGQTGSAGGVLPAPLAAKVTDANGRPVPNTEVSFQALFGNGVVTPASARTNGAGIATTSLSLPTTAGVDVRVRAILIDTLTGTLIDSVSFHANVVGGPPAAIVPTSATPGVARVGTTVPPLEVQLSDQFGNRSVGATVTWTVAAGGGTVNPASSTSDANGRARAGFTLGAASGTNLVTAKTGVVSTTFTIEGRVPGEPETMWVSSSHSTAPIADAVPIAITVSDAFGDPAAGARISWSVSEGGGSVSPATSVTNASGVASTSFTLGSVPGMNVLEATVGSLHASIYVEGHDFAKRLAYTDGSAFGIARTAGGRFVVSLIHDGAIVTFGEGSPSVQTRIALGGTPTVVAVDPAGAFAYVSDMDGWLEIVDLASNTVVKRILITNAHALALGPGGDKVYVTTTSGLVVAVSTASRQVVGSAAVPNGPWGIAFRTTGTDSLMYVTARDGGTVTEVDTKTMTVLRTFTVGGRPHGLAISPDGSTLYVADNQTGQVKSISTGTGAMINAIPLSGAFGMGISPDGSTLYVTTDNSQAAVITASTLAITQLYQTGGNGRQLVVSPDGATAWAANEGGWVDIIQR